MKSFLILSALALMLGMPGNAFSQDVLYKASYGFAIGHSAPNGYLENLSLSGTYYSYQGNAEVHLGSNESLGDTLNLRFTPEGNALHVALDAEAGGGLTYGANQVWFSDSAISTTVETFVRLPRGAEASFSRRIAAEESLLSAFTGNHLSQAFLQVDNTIYTVNESGDLLFNDTIGPELRELSTPALVYNNNFYYRADSSFLSLSMQAYALESGSVSYSAGAQMDLNSAVPEPANAVLLLSVSVTSLGLVRSRRRNKRLSREVTH